MPANESQAKITEVTASSPCIHCGKPDWCYSLGNLTVCKRDAEPAQGWTKTTKADKDGTAYYAPAQPQKAIRAKNRQEFFYPDRQGNKLIKIRRIDDGTGKKSFPQSHWNGKRWINGVPASIRDQIPIYRYREVKEAIAAGKPIFFVEGEGVADALWIKGLAATTSLGGSGKYRSYGCYTEDLRGADLILCPDRDEPGLKHMEEVEKDFPSAKWLYAPPNDFWWNNPPKSGGLDVGDWINDGATVADLTSAVTNKCYSLLKLNILSSPARGREKHENNNHPLNNSEEDWVVPAAEEWFTQKAQDALYGDTPYISLDGNLYRWVGTHYHLLSLPAEKARIAHWCASTPVEIGKRWVYSYAKPGNVEAIWNWVLLRFSIDPALINPPGINCLNGVVKLEWHELVPRWELVAHNPEMFYTYVSKIEYNPDADSSNCDRLLLCLEPEQREIFIRTMAASLDLKKIRQFRGRNVRALLCQGEGNNGKDSLREAVQTLYDVGVVSTTVSDFATYDYQNKKFSLAKLEHARVSWSSENSSFKQLDELQSLKAAITGDTLDMERKNKDERPMNPCCIFLFNINNVPSLQASMEAILSRYAVLSFNKTFKTNADPSKGEIEADPRFRYDPTFLQREVVPALLNKMLAALPEVASKAIDYSCTEEALKDIQRDVNHLWAFCQDVGLDYLSNGKIYVNELWDALSQWYQDNGTATITVNRKGNEVLEFLSEPARKGDKNVTGKNKVVQRFQELFPKAKHGNETGRHPTHPKQTYLLNIGFVGRQWEPTGEPTGKPPNVYGEGRGTQQGIFCSSPSEYLKKIGVDAFISSLDQTQLEEILVKIGQLGSRTFPVRKNCLPGGFPGGFPVGSPNASTVSGDTKFSKVSANTSLLNAPITSGGSGSITQDNSTKNFDRQPTNHQFKVGDKCKAKHPDLWGVPPDKNLTIKRIELKPEGNTAHVTFNGCRSTTGSEVQLSDLVPVEE